MLPIEKNKDFLKDENDPQFNSKHSFLNVNATEFFPSMAAQGQEHKDPVSITSVHFSTESNEDGIHIKMPEFSPLSYLPHVTESYNNDVAFPQQQDFEESACSLLAHIQNIGIVSGTNNDGDSTQKQEFIQPTAQIEQSNISKANIDETACSLRQKCSHDDYSSMDSSYEVTNTETSEPKWQEYAPIPCMYENYLVNDHFFMNDEFLERYKVACDTAFSPGDDWDTEPEPNDVATDETTYCLPDTEFNLNVNTNNILENILEQASAASLSPEADNATDGTISSIETLKNNNNEIKTNKNEENIHSVIDPAVTLGDKAIEEDAQSLVMHKQNKKKNKPHIKEVCSKKEHVNIIFIGHVDAGKSTLGGQLMFLTGMVDKRTMDKYKKEAKEISRDSWYLSWALDTNQEERDKGKTVETGRGHFETDTKHFTILDAPGHKNFVPNMINGAAQADVAVLVLSARQNEFESGFVKGGQTRDHALLAKSAGLNVLIALVNKMDDSTVKWNEKRFNYCRTKTLPYIKQLGYAPKEVCFIPISAQTGDGVVTAVPKSICPWFKGPCFLECLENLPPFTRLFDSPFVMPIAERFRDMGTVVMGKVEAGSVHISDSLLLMPNKVTVSVEQIWSDDKEVTLVKAGEIVKLRLKGIDDEEISPGFVLCDIKKPITTATLFDAQLHILDCKSIITPGYSAVMHFQCVAENVTVTHLLCLVDPKTNVKTRKHNLQFVKKNDEAIMRIQCSRVICLTTFKDFNQLGRFTLRDDNKVIAIGKVLKIIKM